MASFRYFILFLLRFIYTASFYIKNYYIKVCATHKFKVSHFPSPLGSSLNLNFIFHKITLRNYSFIRKMKLKILHLLQGKKRFFFSSKKSSPRENEGEVGKGEERSEEDFLTLLESIKSPMFSSYVLSMHEVMKNKRIGLKEILQSKAVMEYAKKLGIEDRVESAIKHF